MKVNSKETLLNSVCNIQTDFSPTMEPRISKLRPKIRSLHLFQPQCGGRGVQPTKQPRWQPRGRPRGQQWGHTNTLFHLHSGYRPFFASCLAAVQTNWCCLATLVCGINMLARLSIFKLFSQQHALILHSVFIHSNIFEGCPEWSLEGGAGVNIL